MALGCCWGGHSAPKVGQHQAPGRPEDPKTKSSHARSHAGRGCTQEGTRRWQGRPLSLLSGLPVAGNSPSEETPQPPGLSAAGPQELENARGPGREARAAPGPHTRCAHPATDICPAPLPASCSAIPFITASWDPNGFHHGPTPTPRGAGAGRGPGHPHHSPRPPSRRPCFSCCGLCAPRLFSASPLGRLAPLRPLVSTLQPLHSAPTNLSLLASLSPLLPPICSSQECPRASDGPLRPSLCLSLCTCLSVSLRPVTSNSFSGADRLFPGCSAAVLTLWRGRNNFDFLIPPAANLRSAPLPLYF